MSQSEFDFGSVNRAEIFHDRSVLKSAVPDEIVGRKAERERLFQELIPVTDGEVPDHVFLTGPNGTGKTATMRSMVNRLANTPDVGEELTVVKQNCQSVSSGYQLQIRLINKLREEREVTEKLSSSGYSQDDVTRMWFQEINRHSGIILFVLDEIDEVNEIDDTIYEISRAGDPESEIRDRVDLGLLATANDSTFVESELSQSTKSSLDDVEINFSPYNANELREVLRNRAEKAFEQDTLTDDVIPLCAAEGARYNGDARLTLDFLRKAGKLAESDGASEVTEEHVRNAVENHFRQNVMNEIRDLNDNQRMALYSLIVREQSSDRPPRTRQIYKYYEEMAENAGRDAVGSRQFRNITERLDDANITDSTLHEGGEDGKYRTHVLNHDPGEVLEEISGTVDYIGVYEPVQDLVSEDLLS